ncbi:hypothetical protein N9B14_06095, partial [Akkermansiaceae bacterium]|nr:hypothetical protein [Akkermansiaceae bacterium]
MISKNGLFAAAWAVSCGAAFLIGRGSSDSPGTTGNLDFQKNTVASRSAPRGQQSVDPSKPSGRVASSSTGTSSSRQIEAIREEAKALKNMSDPIARAEKFLEFVKNLSPDQYLAAVDSYREGGIENE